MKRPLFLLMLLAVAISSCTKVPAYNEADQLKKDDATIAAYLSANKIPAVLDPSGLYYEIKSPGDSTSHPTASSTITVDYIGKILNGATFDQQSNYTAPLAATIAGWQIGLPHVGNGGEIMLFIPSPLAYGPNQEGIIPPVSILTFDIHLTNVD